MWCLPASRASRSAETVCSNVKNGSNLAKRNFQYASQRVVTRIVRSMGTTVQRVHEYRMLTVGQETADKSPCICKVNTSSPAC
jgi:hypothetical protein